MGNEEQAIKNIEKQLKVGYINFIDKYNIDEIQVLRKAIQEYKNKTKGEK